MADEQTHDQYLGEHNIKALLTDIVEHLCLKKPPNPHAEIIKFLRSGYPKQTAEVFGEISGGTREITETLEGLDFFDDEDEDDGEDDVDDIIPLSEMTSKRKPSNMLYSRGTKDTTVGGKGGSRRCSVSAAVLNKASVLDGKTQLAKELAALPAKAADVTEKLTAFVKGLTMFKSLDEPSVAMIVKAMKQKEFAADTEIIHQGDRVADSFYILESGTATVWKDGAQVHEYHSGDGFGELALMYNAARAATVKASTDCTTWAIDQRTFKVVVMSSAMEHRELVEKFLSNVPLLASLSKLEVHNMAESMETYKYNKDNVIIKEGDEGNMFYVLKDGAVDCNKGGTVVATLSSGAYFGEIALLTKQTRQATVLATQDNTEVLGVDRAAFQRVMGPLGEILKRNLSHYNEVIKGQRM